MESAVTLEVPNKVDYESGPNWGNIKQEETMKQYVDKFMIWQLHNRREIVCFVAGLIVGAIIL